MLFSSLFFFFCTLIFQLDSCRRHRQELAAEFQPFTTRRELFTLLWRSDNYSVTGVTCWNQDIKTNCSVVVMKLWFLWKTRRLIMKWMMVAEFKMTLEETGEGFIKTRILFHTMWVNKNVSQVGLFKTSALNNCKTEHLWIFVDRTKQPVRICERWL